MNKQPPLIAHIIYSLGTGGLENGLVNIINRTPPERYRHVIICLTAAQAFAQRITAPNVDIVELHKRDGQDWNMYWRLFWALKKLRPDIIHTRNLAALDCQVLGLFLPRVKQVHGEHGRDIYDLDGSNWKYRLLRKFMRLWVQRYIAVSRDLEQWLTSSIGVNQKRVKQIYNGVDHERFTVGSGIRLAVFPEQFIPSDDTLVIGTVGRLVEVKNQLLILQAARLLLDSNAEWRDNLRIILVGAGPLQSFLEQQIQELGLDEMVWLTGDRDDIPVLLQAMDVFILPSLGEGISNTVLEAMATKLPVIASDVGGNPELIEDGVNGRLFPVGDAQALSDILMELLQSEELRSSISSQALLNVRALFDWNKTVEEYLKVYDGLLGLSQADCAKEHNPTSLNDMEAG